MGEKLFWTQNITLRYGIVTWATPAKATQHNATLNYGWVMKKGIEMWDWSWSVNDEKWSEKFTNFRWRNVLKKNITSYRIEFIGNQARKRNYSIAGMRQSSPAKHRMDYQHQLRTHANPQSCAKDFIIVGNTQDTKLAIEDGEREPKANGSHHTSHKNWAHW